MLITNITLLISGHLQCQLAVVMLPVLGAAKRLPHEHDVDGRPAHCGHQGVVRLVRTKIVPRLLLQRFYREITT